ncbi:Transporter [Candidatus Rhodobacter oscarellae]|uniref:Transporter n=1 Tax=Candidatus Rhodobacter oscarellae TaxID=1675527 RepID=A0A0J9E6J4_9RHOB|nr:TIGR02281 family clan AA aspartic protease [Candidatus Rhodobacter lobularis]KMW57444.1 Transporter [Candidatus Rhodobacter lobularis]
MTGDETARLIYLALLGSVIAGYALLANRKQLGTMLRHGLLWALIILGLVAGYGLWEDVRRDLVPQQAVFADEARIELPRQQDGHYYLRADLDGQRIDFIVDTGATDIVLSRQDAEKVGVDLDSLIYSGIANTANGQVRSARAVIDLFEVGDIVDRNVTVWVNEGELIGSLLGMAYLQRFDRIEIADDMLVLHR